MRTSGHPTEIKTNGSTYRASQGHLDEDDQLLPRSQQAQVDCSKTCGGHGAEAQEEGIDVGYVVYAIGRV